jgi:hypothetical protein
VLDGLSLAPAHPFREQRSAFTQRPRKYQGSPSLRQHLFFNQINILRCMW